MSDIAKLFISETARVIFEYAHIKQACGRDLDYFMEHKLTEVSEAILSNFQSQGVFIGKLKPISEATKEDLKQRRMLLIDAKNDRRKHPLSRVVVGAYFTDGIEGPEWAVYDYERDDHTDFKYGQPTYFMSLDRLVIPTKTGE